MMLCKRCRKPIRHGMKKRIRSGYCRHCYIYIYHKNKRIERRKNKLCAICGGKVKPKLVHPYRCEKCKNRYVQTKKAKAGG